MSLHLKSNFLIVFSVFFSLYFEKWTINLLLQVEQEQLYITVASEHSASCFIVLLVHSPEQAFLLIKYIMNKAEC